MAKNIRSSGDFRLDPLSAIKRAYLHRGYVLGGPRARLKPKPAQAAPPSEPADSQENQDVHEKLIDITEKAQDVLFEADTVFPFTLFPDSITLDREKLTVATRSFFRTAKIVSVPVSSISSAEADVGPLFGSIHLASKFFVQNKYSVNFLTRAHAIKLQHLLQGFIISQEKNIDVTDIDTDDLLLLLTDLGQGVSE